MGPSRTLVAPFRREEPEQRADHRERVRPSRRHAEGRAQRHLGRPSMLSQRRGFADRKRDSVTAGGIFKRGGWWEARDAADPSGSLANTSAPAEGVAVTLSWRSVGVGAWNSIRDRGRRVRSPS